MKPYVLDRFSSVLNPWAEEYVYGEGYQLTQALIAFGRGGVCESVFGLEYDRPTGLFFAEQSVDSICGAVLEFEKNADRILPINCCESAMRFSTERFQDELLNSVRQAWRHHERISKTK